MKNCQKYVFQSLRLGFREWAEEDIQEMFLISSDTEVMKFFPEPQTIEQTKDLVRRMQQQFAKNCFCYFAVEVLETEEFIGFIGLAEINFEASFTPAVDIGWRLAKSAWNKGYATEGANRCVRYGFDVMKLKSIKSIAPEINTKSINVMKKIGMKQKETFKHPFLADCKRLENCVLYEIENNS
ncbi:Protein N-acetyltransferase, RimJ/RimL family [Dyadobacter koreensis]|uniref:Protein N-acetyltransferase, RimJ/RimL family n=1 Tax=Dyadobacter koreensis TaxID=408657 RepID=A0A1H6QK20_9BACT|nr:GNAT family N-acetyltransferase [Dyadobacter koreensis]SEI44078.1 Protein N-acetyltransferase, RimJ/RimL family [Dyadobacter koreensis]